MRVRRVYLLREEQKGKKTKRTPIECVKNALYNNILEGIILNIKVQRETVPYVRFLKDE